MDAANSSEILTVCTGTHEATTQKTEFLLISFFLHFIAFNPHVTFQTHSNKDGIENNASFTKEVAWKYQMEDT